jgi:hypothetical protein
MAKINRVLGGRNHLCRFLPAANLRWVSALTLIVLALWGVAGCSESAVQVESTVYPEPTLSVETHMHETAVSDAEVELPHVHGMGFSGDGQSLSVAVHDGLRIFSRGRWLVPEITPHDYMGYTVTSEAFYSSGHPAPGSSLRNPLGLVKSTDGGETLAQLGFESESDFHVMDVGYYSHIIYVVNLQANSKLASGVHYSLDDGANWRQAALNGFTGQPVAIAVHPTEANVLAMTTADGLFLSEDYGDNFASVSSSTPATAVEFSPDGKILFFGYLTLSRYQLENGLVESVSIPEIAADDAIAYIAVTPVDSAEIAFATFHRHIFHSVDSGQTWHAIAKNGKAINLQY